MNENNSATRNAEPTSSELRSRAAKAVWARRRRANQTGERIPACEIHHYSATDGKCVDCGKQFNYEGNAPRDIECYSGQPLHFRSRYINIAALTDSGGTISIQCWCSSSEDIYDAERKMNSWLLPDNERWHGKIMHATMFDTQTKELRHFVRVCDGLLKEIKINA
jgi:hypothetical protein